MRSIVTVAQPASCTSLTTLARVKLELDITDSDSDEVLEEKIEEASDDIAAALGFRVVREDAEETFWHEQYDSIPDKLLLDRIPVASIDSVIVDGQTVDESLWRLDPDTGELFALDSSGRPCLWIFYTSVVVSYSGGYILPDESGRNLPKGIEGACIDLVSSFWAAKGRDPALKSYEVPNVISEQFWVGAVGEDGELPPSVVMKLARYRKAIAV